MADPLLAAVPALLAGGLVWLGWHWRLCRRPVNLRVLLCVLLIAGFLGRLAFVFVTPIFHAPDEQSHFNHLRHVAEQRSFPVQTSRLGDPANDWEHNQPPLYYLLLAPVYAAAEAVFHNQTATVLTLRLCSLPLWLLNVVFGVVLLRRLRVQDEAVRLSVVALIALLPTYTFVSAVINNDNLLAALGGAALCVAARGEYSVKMATSLGVLLGLALLTKQSAVVLLPATLLPPLLNGGDRKVQWSVRWGYAGLAAATAALIYFPWVLRNWQHYGTLFPEHLTPYLKSWPSPLYGLASAAHNLIKTFWAAAGISNEISQPLAVPGMVLLVAALAGLAWRWRQNRSLAGLAGEIPLPVIAAFALAVVINGALVLRFGYLFGMGQGRHLFGLLHPIALLLALGLRAWPLNNPLPLLSGFWLGWAAAFVVFCLLRFP